LLSTFSLLQKLKLLGTQVRSVLLLKLFSLLSYHYCIAVKNLWFVGVIRGEGSGFEQLGFAVRVILGLLKGFSCWYCIE